MLTIDSGTAISPIKENITEETGSFIRTKIKTSEYTHTFSNIDSTSIASDKSVRTKNTIDDNSDIELKGHNSRDRSDSVKSIKNIYFEDTFISSKLRNGFDLLINANGYVEKALESFEQGDRKRSDEYIMQFKSFLPELFCCRDISESFGVIINSIHNALLNIKGLPLSKIQLTALKNIINGLIREPAMSFSKAVDYVSEFEEADFEVESSGLEGLLKLVEMMNEDESEIINA